MRQIEELIGYIARSLVDDPDAVEVEAIDGDNTIVVELTVAKADLGKVIGREGRTARAIRTLDLFVGNGRDVLIRQHLDFAEVG